jgi:5-methylcytosine-specific restriction protein A
MDALSNEEIQKNLDFEVGQRYVRKDLHDVCGGNHQPGISPVRDLSAIFLFASTAESEYGYKDEWLPNDHFLLTGVGRDGDQAWNGLNKSLATHEEDDRRVFLFEKVPNTDPTVVTYVGEFEYVNHREDTLPDRTGELRRAYRFELRPVSGGTIVATSDMAEATLDELYDLAKRASPEGARKSTDTTRAESYTRSNVVKRFALREADGLCQGCEKSAPFRDEDGDPYLEVHHLHRVSDRGPDDPDNVIALCPNCHARVHYGSDGDEFNHELLEKASSRSYSWE